MKWARATAQPSAVIRSDHDSVFEGLKIYSLDGGYAILHNRARPFPVYVRELISGGTTVGNDCIRKVVREAMYISAGLSALVALVTHVCTVHVSGVEKLRYTGASAVQEPGQVDLSITIHRWQR